MLKINEVSYCNFKLLLDYSLRKKNQFQQVDFQKNSNNHLYFIYTFINVIQLLFLFM
jgi:hypothetical protein